MFISTLETTKFLNSEINKQADPAVPYSTDLACLFREVLGRARVLKLVEISCYFCIVISARLKPKTMNATRLVLTGKWAFIGAEKFIDTDWMESQDFIDTMTWEFHPQYFGSHKVIGQVT